MYFMNSFLLHWIGYGGYGDYYGSGYGGNYGGGYGGYDYSGGYGGGYGSYGMLNIVVY